MILWKHTLMWFKGLKESYFGQNMSRKNSVELPPRTILYDCWQPGEVQLVQKRSCPQALSGNYRGDSDSKKLMLQKSSYLYIYTYNHLRYPEIYFKQTMCWNNEQILKLPSFGDWQGLHKKTTILSVAQRCMYV